MDPATPDDEATCSSSGVPSHTLRSPASDAGFPVKLKIEEDQPDHDDEQEEAITEERSTSIYVKQECDSINSSCSLELCGAAKPSMLRVDRLVQRNRDETNNYESVLESVKPGYSGRLVMGEMQKLKCKDEYEIEEHEPRNLDPDGSDDKTFNCTSCSDGKECRRECYAVNQQMEENSSFAKACNDTGKSFHKKERICQDNSAQDRKGRTMRNFNCTECPYACKTIFNLKRHINMRHNPNAKVYKCVACKYTSKCKSNLKLHVQTQHEGKIETYKCTECNDTFRYRSSLKRHVNMNHDAHANKYTCAECRYTTKCKQLLTRHWKLLHDVNAEVHKCLYCDYSTKRKHNIRTHTKAKHNSNAKLYKCAECVYTTTLVNDFYTHVKLKHDINTEQYKCRECAYVSKYKSNLTVHIQKYHEGKTKLYKCAECDSSFEKRSTYYNHVKQRHDPGAEYRCERCEYASKSKLVFIRHRKSCKLSSRSRR